MSTYVEDVREIKIELYEYYGDKEEELNEFNYPHHQASFDLEMLEERLQDVNVYRMSDFWFSKFRGGSYYCGILNLEPWYVLTESDKHGGPYTEEDIWQLILNHVQVDPKTRTVKFRWNKESPINGFIRYWNRKISDVAMNIETVFETAIKYLVEKDDSLWTFEELYWCEECGMTTFAENGKCPECGSRELQFAWE